MIDLSNSLEFNDVLEILNSHKNYHSIQVLNDKKSADMNVFLVVLIVLIVTSFIIYKIIETKNEKLAN